MTASGGGGIFEVNCKDCKQKVFRIDMGHSPFSIHWIRYRCSKCGFEGSLEKISMLEDDIGFSFTT